MPSVMSIWPFILVILCGTYTVHCQGNTKFGNSVKVHHFGTDTVKHYFQELLAEVSQADLGEHLKLAFIKYVLMSRRSTQHSQCLADISAIMHNNLDNNTIGALTMLDSMGKPGSGLFRGALMFTGDFDECQSVIKTYKKGHGHNETNEIKGQYCSAKFDLSIPLSEMVNRQWGICAPDSCSSSELLNLLNFLMTETNITFFTFTEMECRQDVALSQQAVAVICVVSLLVLLVVIGTILDVILVQLPRHWAHAEVHNLENGGNHETDCNGCSSQKIVSETTKLTVGKRAENMNHEPSLTLKLFLAFSLWSNTETLLNTHLPKGHIGCLHGIRVFSISWIVLGHSYSTSLEIANNGALALKEMFKAKAFQVVPSSNFAVDSFFMLAGCLVAYMSLNELRNKKFSWVGFYVHRYCRLSPPYFLISAIYLVTSPYWTFGPFHSQSHLPETYCSKTWWAFLLYIQNFVSYENCLIWTWYLAVDMHFYIVSPLIFMPLFYKPWAGYLSALAFFLVTTITSYILTVQRYLLPGIGHFENAKEPGNVFHDYYIASYCRMGPFIVGMLLGYICYLLNGRQLKLHPVISLIGWVSAAVVAVFIIYGLYDNLNGEPYKLHVAALYNSLARPTWGLCIAWVLFSCITGNASPVNAFLSWQVWIPLSRLSYCMYLCHKPLLLFIVLANKAPIMITNISVMFLFLGTLLAGFGLSYLCSMVFEVPFIKIEKIFMRLVGKKRKPVDQNKLESNSEDMTRNGKTGEAKDQFPTG